MSAAPHKTTGPEDPIQQAILQAWNCALAGMPVIYLSGPITTGPRFVESLRLGRRDSRDIIEQNSEDIIATAARLRRERSEVVVEPASLRVDGWSQRDYLDLWKILIERHVRLMLFMPGWEYSLGCVTEFLYAVALDIRTETVSGQPITLLDAHIQLSSAIASLENSKSVALVSLAAKLSDALQQLKIDNKPKGLVISGPLRKDAALDVLADKMNVAQFVSFEPRYGRAFQTFARVAGEPPNIMFRDIWSAASALLSASVDHSVNVRSYEPHNPQSREFVYGLTQAKDVVEAVERLTGQGLHTIVNETIDIHDGGVSGVLMGDVMEVAPDDTPRCVEKPGTASLPRGWGRELLAAVYGIRLALDIPLNSRLEFSIHPRPRGWRHTNTLAWEYEAQGYIGIKATVRWPNRFSRLLGDKVFGLLVAHHAGLPVPFTTVINRRIAPFSFGRPTNAGERWIRTAPVEQVPGKFTTHRGWLDPFELMRHEDSKNQDIASMISQHGVHPEFSGALIVGRDGDVIVEGKRGDGQSLMLGVSAPEQIPPEIENDVRVLYERAEAALGAVRFEWVYDAEQVWIVQMHSGATQTTRDFINAMPANVWQEFDVERGLEDLRRIVATLPHGTGISLSRKVGLTSHIADVLRKANVPARMISAH